MKKIVTILSLIFVVGLTTVSAQCCQSKTETKCGSKREAVKAGATCTDVHAATDVKAYYFHATRRCATCQAVEEVTKETISKDYASKVSFESINREEDKDNPLIEKYKISGQTLLIIKGDKVVNLTNDAFMYARTKPEKLKTKLKATLDSML